MHASQISRKTARSDIAKPVEHRFPPQADIARVAERIRAISGRFRLLIDR